MELREIVELMRAVKIWPRGPCQTCDPENRDQAFHPVTPLDPHDNSPTIDEYSTGSVSDFGGTGKLKHAPPSLQNRQRVFPKAGVGHPGDSHVDEGVRFAARGQFHL